MPDGSIGHDGRLQASLSEVAIDFEPNRIFTLGRNGYDFHPDHITSHAAALGVLSLLRESGLEVNAWALGSGHEGELLAGDYWQKTGAIALHASQTVSPDLDHWGDTDLYTPLIVKGESFEQF